MHLHSITLTGLFMRKGPTYFMKISWVQFCWLKLFGFHSLGLVKQHPSLFAATLYSSNVRHATNKLNSNMKRKSIPMAANIQNDCKNDAYCHAKNGPNCQFFQTLQCFLLPLFKQGWFEFISRWIGIIYIPQLQNQELD